MNASTTFSRTMWGLSTGNFDVVNAGSINTTSMTSSLFKTNLVQSINNTDSLTLEALTTGKVYLKSNGNNCVVADNALVELKTGGTTRFSISDTIATISSMATFNTTTNTISLNGKVVQSRADTAISYGTNCISAPTYVAGVSGLLLVGYGNGALRNNTTGNYNSALGHNALTNVTSGSNNCGFGAEAGRSVNSGSGNMAIGLQALYSTTTTTDNIGIGTQAGFGYTIGGSNVNIGTRSGIITTTFGGSFANTSIGFEAGQGLGAFGGNYCTMVGHRSNYTPNTASFSNSTAIGAFSNITASNQITLGTTSQFVTCGNLSVGKTTAPVGKCDVEGATNINGNLSIKGGNNLQIYNATNTNNMNLFMSGNNYYFNNLSATGTISFQVNSFTLWSITPTVISTNLTITTPTQPPLDNSTNVATTEYVDTAFTAFLNTSNAWTSSNTFNVNLPTSTLNPTINSQLTTKLYVDNKVATTISGVAILANSNTFSGLTNVFNSSGGVSFGVIAPSCSIAPLGDAQLCNKLYTDVNALSPPTKLITWQEDFLTSAGVLPIGAWAYSGTGGAVQSFGTSASHPGNVELTNNKTIYNLTTIESWFPKQIKWIARSTTAINTFNWYAGTSQGVSNYTNSAFIGHTSGTTTFFASVNNTTSSNFTTVTWVTNNWYEMTLDFNDPSIKFTIKNLTTAGNPESITLTSVGFDFNRTNIWSFANVSVAGTNKTDVDYTSLSYQADRV